MITPEEVIAVYGSHDASITFIDKNKNIRVYEYERFVKKRYAMFSSQFDYRSDLGSNDDERKKFVNHIIGNSYNPPENIKLILYLELSDQDLRFFSNFFPNAEFEKMNHHYSHAASGFFTSPFKEALIFSVDGGGYDGSQVYTTRSYHGLNETITNISCPNYDFGNPYSAIGWLISELKSNDKTMHSLSNSGKVMGLCAYGKIREEWISSMTKFYETQNINDLCANLGVNCEINVLSGNMSYDLAATSQFVFETKMNELILPLVEKYKTNIVLVGGCALNVLYNQKLFEYLRNINLDLYIPSNPNDCGQSYGMFLTKFPFLGKKEICYNGIEILDENNLDHYLNIYPNEKMTIDKIIEFLKSGKILGIINDNSEVGPRALGNRSIVCDPSFPKMKDILNSKVKFREWFRPFAPVCREKDMEKFFETVKESKYMSYAPKIKNEYKDLVRSIVHEDDTTRLQTTTKDIHQLFNDILDRLNELNFVPIILNTSFNIKGLPILTSYQDAFKVLDTTELDYLIIKDYIFRKK